MFSLLVAVITAVTLTSPFGEASATAVETLDGAFIEVTVTVEIDTLPSPDFVVVHVLQPEGQQETFSLGGIGDGLYQGSFIVPPFNRAIAFEAGWGATPSALSATTSLTALGVDGSLLRATFPPGESSSSNSNSNWGWIALVAAALAVGALFIGLRLPRAKGAMQLVDASGDATVIDELTHPFPVPDDA